MGAKIIDFTYLYECSMYKQIYYRTSCKQLYIWNPS